MEPMPDLDQRIAAVAALDQPIRRDLYRLLGTEGWTTRDRAAEVLGVARSVAVFHLDKLADAGVVETRFERTSGRTGPGAGRPSKLYRLASDELSASVPDRHYDLAGSLLATAVATSTRTGAPVAQCLRAAARAAGQSLGAEASETLGRGPGEDRHEAMVDALTRCGYEPATGQHQEIVLMNCPFHRLAEEHPDLVCGMNFDFLAGLLNGLDPSGGLTARLQPESGFCCVRIAA